MKQRRCAFPSVVSTQWTRAP